MLGKVITLAKRALLAGHRRHPKGSRYRWALWLMPLTGLLSLIWFLVRVLPKPSRAAYPCQRVAAPLASGFVLWLAGAVGSTYAYRKARALYRQSRYVVAAVFLTVAIAAIWSAISITHTRRLAADPFIPSDPPNTPIGVAKGIHPGRVVWAHDSNATSWDGQMGNWWDDEHTDQEVVDLMVARTIQSVTGQFTDMAAWEVLFRHFNQIRGQEDTGYQPGEKIAIKINMNQDDSAPNWDPGAGMPSPHVIHALLDQLIHVAGVAGEDIVVYDVSKYIGDPIYDKIRANSDPEFQNVRLIVKPAWAKNGRDRAQIDPDCRLYFSDPNVPEGGWVYLPRCITEAKYLINMALLRSHGIFGVTLCAKNHFGSFYWPDLCWCALPLHDFGDRDAPMGSYNCLVDLMGHEHLGGKTLLYMIDALYSARDNTAEVVRFESFGDEWCSSLFASQDPVAIDSVGIDFLRNEPTQKSCRGQGVDNYLHEAALAADPPSGTVYDPQQDGIPLASLGVHEHWNNAIDKLYSRNLGTGEGIELIALRGDGARADLTANGAVNAYDLKAFASAWLAEPNDPHWNSWCDLSADERIDFNDWAWFCQEWQQSLDLDTPLYGTE